jgi:hypothetical protein
VFFFPFFPAGMVAGLILTSRTQARMHKAMTEPMTEEEFDFASQLVQDDGKSECHRMIAHYVKHRSASFGKGALWIA